MLVFIDESGDPGFKTPKGSSKLFAVVMVIFQSNEDAVRTGNEIDQLAVNLGIKPEFKFSNSRPEVRDHFFDLVADLPFGVRAIVVQKEVIYSPHLRSNKDDFYRYFVRSMVRHNGGRLELAKVVIDGSGDRVFKQDLRNYLKRDTPPGCITRVTFKNSKSDRLLQLADMCVGAIARSYRSDRKDAARWRNKLRQRIDDIWDFR